MNMQNNPNWQPPTGPSQFPYQQPPPPYPQQPYYPNVPPPMMTPQPPPKKRHTWLWIIGILVALAVIGSFASHGGTSTGTSPTATQAPAQVAPTNTPAPTALTNPNDIKSELQSDAYSALTASNITADYGAQLSKAVIFETSLIKQPLSFIQSECFNIQKTVWQDQQLRVKIVDFTIATVNGQLPNVYGECMLDENYAIKIDWNATDAATAWNNKIYQNMTP